MENICLSLLLRFFSWEKDPRYLTWVSEKKNFTMSRTVFRLAKKPAIRCQRLYLMFSIISKEMKSFQGQIIWTILSRHILKLCSFSFTRLKILIFHILQYCFLGDTHHGWNESGNVFFLKRIPYDFDYVAAFLSPAYCILSDLNLFVAGNLRGCWS